MRSIRARGLDEPLPPRFKVGLLILGLLCLEEAELGLFNLGGGVPFPPPMETKGLILGLCPTAGLVIWDGEEEFETLGLEEEDEADPDMIISPLFKLTGLSGVDLPCAPLKALGATDAEDTFATERTGEIRDTDDVTGEEIMG